VKRFYHPVECTKVSAPAPLLGQSPQTPTATPQRQILATPLLQSVETVLTNRWAFQLYESYDISDRLVTRNSEKQTHCRTYSCRPAPGLTSKEFVSTSSRCISSTEQQTSDNIALKQAIQAKSNVAILPMLVSRDPLTTNHVAPHRRCGTLSSYKYVTSSVFKIFLAYNSTQLNRELRTQVSDTSKSAS